MSDNAQRLDLDSEPGNRQSGVSKTPDGLIGTVIDRRYRVETLLGEGGMGRVYRASHVQLHKPLAIKILRSENSRDEEVLARFRREAESASNIGNEHIVDIHDFGTLPDGSTFFVMECLQGNDLIDAIDAVQRFSEDRAVHIARQVCLALAAAHDAGIVHRDLKPENVFLIRRRDDRDFVKVLDFGIAKMANRPHRLTRDGEVLGTPHYMSPEQCAGEAIDHRTDVYALGVLLYEMVTGHVPHDADTMMGILTKHLYDEPAPPSSRLGTVSSDLERIIMRCLEKRPEHRYQTMHEVEADLGKLEDRRHAVGPETVTLTPRLALEKGARSRTPKTAFLLGLAALVLLGVVALGWGLTNPGDEVTAESGTQNASEVDAISSETVDAPPLAKNEPTKTVASVPVTSAAQPKTKRTRPAARAEPTPPDTPARDQGPILDPWK